MAVISLSSPLPFLPRHPMNLPSLPSEVLTLTASYPSWQPFITPPWSSKPHHPTMTTLPPITSLQRQYHYRDTAYNVPSEEHVASWFSDSRSRSSQYTAENTFIQPQSCQHFSLTPFIPFNPKTAKLQFSVSSVFVHFMQKLLQTTQLSQSVIVLSLHYVYRLKERNSGTIAHPGSEFRVARRVSSNTYTNKTWSEVSGIELNEINKMEREFLAGIDFNLYVDEETYVRWVGLLEGLVTAKERGSRQWRRSRQTPRAATVARPMAPLTVPSKGRNWSAPRGSNSPHSFTNSNPQYSPRIAIERSALDAFSPTSATFDHDRPAKRPISLAVEIPQSGGSSSFSKLSLGSSPALSQCAEGNAVLASARHIPPQTLIASYRLDPTKPRPVPKHLFFYSLAGSPMADDSRSRKGLLRYHQPPESSAPSYYAYPPPPVPFAIHSASTSPHHHSCVTLPPVLPSNAAVSWTRHTAVPAVSHDSNYTRGGEVQESLPGLREATNGSVLLAPFANAGPPGVHYHYPTPAYSPDYHWRRGRRL
ncbi:hypothetical protein BJV77DRAFT_1059980 [Russula vinacea]|nr:hypothetical protein BJV77DRAFT_1059980 [Russula vinacea]